MARVCPGPVPPDNHSRAALPTLSNASPAASSRVFPSRRYRYPSSTSKRCVWPPLATSASDRELDGFAALAGLHNNRVDVSFHVIHRYQRLARGVRQSLSVCDANQQRSDQPRAFGHRDCVHMRIAIAQWIRSLAAPLELWIASARVRRVPVPHRHTCRVCPTATRRRKTVSARRPRQQPPPFRRTRIRSQECEAPLLF